MVNFPTDLVTSAKLKKSLSIIWDLFSVDSTPSELEIIDLYLIALESFYF